MASLARAGRLLSRAGALATGVGRASAPQIVEHFASVPGNLQHVRQMASGKGLCPICSPSWKSKALVFYFAIAVLMLFPNLKDCRQIRCIS